MIETHNAQMIREGMDKQQRFSVLQEIANYQRKVIEEVEHIGKEQILKG